MAFTVTPHMANAFLDDDVPAVMATPGPTGLAPIPAVSRGADVGPARASLRLSRLNHVYTNYKSDHGLKTVRFDET